MGCVECRHCQLAFSKEKAAGTDTWRGESGRVCSKIATAKTSKKKKRHKVKPTNKDEKTRTHFKIYEGKTSARGDKHF